MFERYTEKARRVIFFARYEASQCGSPYLESEHLLLGLLREDKALAHRFMRSSASSESIRKQIDERNVVREKIATSVDLPLSNDCKRVLANAAEEAERLAHQHIGTEHLLLGLLREEKCFAAELLTQRGLSFSAIRDELRASPHVSSTQTLASERGRFGLRRSVTSIPIRFMEAGSSQKLLEQEWLLSAAPLPRTGETIELREASEPDTSGRIFRVEDVRLVFVAAKQLPQEVSEVQQKLQSIVAMIENAIANHEFEKSRFYSEEERKQRDKLRELKSEFQLSDIPDEPTAPHLREIVVTLAAR